MIIVVALNESQLNVESLGDITNMTNNFSTVVTRDALCCSDSGLKVLELLIKNN